MARVPNASIMLIIRKPPFLHNPAITFSGIKHINRIKWILRLRCQLMLFWRCCGRYYCKANLQLNSNKSGFFAVNT